MVNRIKTPSPDDPFKKGNIHKEGVNGEKKIEKTREVDPEEKKRRKFKKHLEKSEETPPKPELPSPYQTNFYEEKKTGGIYIKKLDATEKTLTVDTEEKSTEEKSLIKTLDNTPFSVTSMTDKTNLHTTDSKLEKNLENKESSLEKPPLHMEKPPKYSSSSYREDTPLPTVVFPSNPPLEIEEYVIETIQNNKIELSPQIHNLFSRMVGTIHMMSEKEGIMKTSITLDNPQFENSVFYGSTVTLEKYSSAPQSFNIFFTGNEAAVSTIIGNTDILMEAFKKGNFNFKINRIETSYTQPSSPVFRRKGSLGDKDFGQSP